HGESLASQGMSVESPGGELAYVGKRTSDMAYDIPIAAKPQVGEASMQSAKIENRMDQGTGLANQTEGQASLKIINPAMPSITQILRERTKYLAQVMVKLGVKNMEQLHTLGT